MLGLLGLVVSAVATTLARDSGTSAREVEITWRHWGRDDPDVWFMDVEYPSSERCLEVARITSL